MQKEVQGLQPYQMTENHMAKTQTRFNNLFIDMEM